ncbi:MAG: hypothetical protein HY752_03390 [Nitrospirae bacterium]|nr:hypothetical protein [Nitrospirota bacterium]
MKKIILILSVIVLLVTESYAQNFEKRGGLLISVGPSPTGGVKAIAELLITDPMGRCAGLDVSKGVVVQGIPNASYYKERIDDLETGEPGEESNTFEAGAPIDGLYKIAVIGTSSGKYGLDIFAYDINFKGTVQKLDSSTYPGKIDSYEVTYSSAPGSQVKVTFVGSSEIPVFDGKGQRPTDVNKFLQYFNPIQARTELPAGTQNFNLSIIYGNTIKRETFSAMLEGKAITKQFYPIPGKHEIVKIPLIQGSNTLVLSIKGVKTDGKIAEDTDRLVFIVP